MDRAEEPAVFWRRAAGRTALRINAARWLASFIPVFAGVNVLAALLLILWKLLGLPPAPFWIGYGVLLALGAIVVFLRVRRRFFGISDAMVRLEAFLGLRNRLTAASQGIGPWPPPRSSRGDGLVWDLRRTLAAPLLSLLLLGVFWSIPLTPGTDADAYAPREPLAWTRMEEWIETLQEEEIVRDDALERWRERIEALRQRPESEWYTHSSLEAGDTLKETMEGGLRALDRDLAAASSLLAFLEEKKASLDAEAWRELSKKLRESAAALSAEPFPLSPELLEQLRELADADLRYLSPEELQRLRARLREGCRGCNRCLGLSGEEAALVLAAADAGRGGVERGPGPAPLTVNPEETNLGTKRTESLPPADLRDARIGDLVGVGSTAPEVDETAPTGLSAGGTIVSPGAGGETVWKTPLTPREREILQRYFQ